MEFILILCFLVVLMVIVLLDMAFEEGWSKDYRFLVEAVTAVALTFSMYIFVTC